MGDGTPRTFSAALRGAGASQMTLGGIDLLRSGLIKGVDIYLEAGQSPQVVIRPILDQVLLDLTAGDLDGKAPRYKVAPDVAFLLEEMGWMPPEATETAQYATATRNRERDELKAQLASIQSQHQVALDRIRGLEQERKDLSWAHFSCGDKLATLEQGQAYWKAQHVEAQDRVEVLETDASDLEGALAQAVAKNLDLQERITAQETELETAAQAVEQAQTDKARMAEELANVNGHLEDLKLANATLQEEMTSLQAETAGAGVSISLRNPYDPAA